MNKILKQVLRQSYFVFVKDKAIIFGDSRPFENVQSIEFSGKFDAQFPDFILSQSANEIRLVFSDPLPVKKQFSRFIDSFPVILAAGGIIRDENNRILGILRMDRWDFPKGKKEKNEHSRDCALREVQEETGLLCSIEPGFTFQTFHMYDLNKRWVIKKTYWYELRASSTQKFIPQTDEGIKEVRWFTDADFKDIFLPETYPTMRLLSYRYLKYKEITI
jgi:8-oxo-dGTP pyrophosphatase MutT (NUDIX family)